MIFEMSSCGGCCTCEIACSYRHTGVFKPSVSSIKIIDRDNDEPGFRVLLIEKTGEEGIECDGCKDHAEPLCVEICHKKEDLLHILREFVDSRSRDPGHNEAGDCP